ncbi:MAG: UPF0175 family protein [Planctomycetes bacterium]|nr:UPF0175 family protein [Planctomycetota bacterium]MBM4087352.1 UPF0175 family protein [Planctomycetota bacterium]
MLAVDKRPPYAVGWEMTALKTVTISEELAQLLGPDERVPEAFTEAALLELYREHRISTGKAAELLGLSYRGFLELLQRKRIPVVTTPPRDPEEVADALRHVKG